ncbi:MAG: hypothetical protein R3F07_01170 [Opitutaceae bacterium]
MTPAKHNPNEELQELRHEAQPGFRTGFWVVLAVTSLVLVLAVLMGTGASTHH